MDNQYLSIFSGIGSSATIRSPLPIKGSGSQFLEINKLQRLLATTEVRFSYNYNEGTNDGVS